VDKIRERRARKLELGGVGRAEADEQQATEKERGTMVNPLHEQTDYLQIEGCQ